MIAPQASAAFVAAMEQVLDIYSRPYDAKHPVVCMDETPRQLIRETREPIAAAPGRPERQAPGARTMMPAASSRGMSVRKR